MKLSLPCFVLASCFCAATYAHATVITSATVYTGIPSPNFNNADSPSNTTGPNHANFTIGGSGINYSVNSATSPNTIAQFLNNPTFSNPSGSFSPSGSPTSLEIVIMGSLTLTTGEHIDLTHDDGASLTLTGFGEVISATGPTVAFTNDYIFTGPNGNYNFVLNYAANDLEPSVLQLQAGGVNVGATPEPSSLILLGTGLASAAGLARRRFARTV